MRRMEFLWLPVAGGALLALSGCSGGSAANLFNDGTGGSSNTGAFGGSLATGGENGQAGGGAPASAGSGNTGGTIAGGGTNGGSLTDAQTDARATGTGGINQGSDAGSQKDASPADAATAGTGGVATGPDASRPSDAGGETDAADAGKKCGNGVVDPGEDCDPAVQGTTGCTKTCHWFCLPGTGDALCNDLLPCDGVETCGSGHTCVPGTNLTDGTPCGTGSVCKSGLCTLSSCGDGITVAPEECDDGNLVNGDGCDNNCRFSCVSTDSTRDCTALQTPCETPTTCNDGTHVCSTPTAKPDDTLCGAHSYCKTGTCTAAVCGNGVVEPTETCDDGNQVNGDGCDNNCAYSCVTPATDCSVPPACQKETCSLAHVCSSVADTSKDDTSCGTKKVCSSGACANACGNGIVDAADGEQCDDGNQTNGDGCNNDCLYSCTNPATDCNGTTPDCDKWACNANSHVCQAVADPSANDKSCGSGLTCNATGSCVNACGNGILDAGEQCDDGNTTDGDGCQHNCVFTCSTPATDCSGNAGTCDKWSCSATTHLCQSVADSSQNGNSCGSSEVCTNGACGNSCGNGHVDPGEVCDDGNKVNGDGCNNNCQYSCTTPATDCTPVPCETESCSASHICQASPDSSQNDHACGSGLVCSAGACINSCGNGLVDAADGEVCDDGNKVNGDGCNNNCQYSCANPSTDCTAAPVCYVAQCSAGHVCQNAVDVTQNDQPCASGKVCSAGACIIACGNGIVDPGEECDDGNQVNGDGCNNDCTFTCADPATDCSAAPACQMETCTSGHLCQAVADPTQNEVTCGVGKVCQSGSCVVACGDGVVETGEQCEPPNTPTCDANCQNQCDVDGSWAMLLTVPVTWAGNLNVAKGAGNVQVWSLVTSTASGTATTVLPCGISFPTFTSTASAAGTTTYFITFPTTLFDSDYLSASAVATTFSTLKAGATYKTNAAFTSLIGMSAPATGAWPLNAAGVTEVDQDGDGMPGVTAATNVPTTAAFGGTPADYVDMALRQTAALSGTLTDCTHLSGTATVSQEDDHVLGCEVAGTGLSCNAFQSTFVDNNRPVYVLPSAGAAKGATFQAEKMSNAATCANVRADYPPYP